MCVNVMIRNLPYDCNSLTLWLSHAVLAQIGTAILKTASAYPLQTVNKSKLTDWFLVGM